MEKNHKMNTKWTQDKEEETHPRRGGRANRRVIYFVYISCLFRGSLYYLRDYGESTSSMSYWPDRRRRMWDQHTPTVRMATMSITPSHCSTGRLSPGRTPQ